MATHHRIAVVGSVAFAGVRFLLPVARALLAAAAVIVACCACMVPNAVSADETPDAPDQSTSEASADGDAAATVPIIVVLAVDPEGAAFADVRKRLMTRLKAVAPPGDYASIRTFQMLPMVALSASPNVIAWLLAQPEVASIEPDRLLVPIAAGESTGERRPATGIAPATQPDPQERPDAHRENRP